jgi:Xaa-Pro aminopeptidase
MTRTEARRAALRDLIAADVDAMLVSSLVNVRYLTGFTGSNAALLVTRDGRDSLATDGRYATQAATEAPDVAELVVGRMLGADLLRALGDRGKRVAVERHILTVDAHDRLRDAVADVELVDAGQPVERLRTVKDDDELASIRQACAVTDAAFDAVLPQLREGVTERDIAWALRSAMRDHGAEPAFDSIVAFGPDSARPHHNPTDRPLQPGDLVKLDFGALVDGYHSDMTRTVVKGAAADWQRDLHDLVRRIQADARAATVAGAVPADLDDGVRDAIEGAGHEVAHGLGHGVGLQIHESPFLTPGSTADRLVDRVPVTVEPGVYLPGRGGVRIEDTVVVRAEGAVALTRSSRDLLVI